MTSYVRSILLGLAMVAVAASSSFAQQVTQPSSGIYIRGDVGVALGTHTTFSDTNPTAANCSLCRSTEPSSVKDEVIFGAGIGYRFTRAFRSDVTLDFIPSRDVNGHNSAFPAVKSNTNVSSLVGLLNGYLDVDGLMRPGMFGRFQPYLVAGVGIAHNDLGRTNYTGAGLGSGTLSQSGAGHTSFAWAAGAGLGYAVTSNLTLDLAYKYIDLGEMRSGSSGTFAGTTATVTPVKADLQAHTIMLGLRYAFGAPAAAPTPAAVTPPPPPPAPAAAPSRQNFIVFFDFDKSSLTPEGQKVVDAAAAAYKSGGRASLQLAGYTDRAGTEQYNLKLSQRRAETVRAALIKDGVPSNQISANWYGEGNPRVPTADGVREPQNRRVEIQF